MQLGVRTDTFENQNLDGETFITMEDQVAPRVGFSWDPMDDGRTKIYGSFGTYFLPVATNTNIRLGGSEYFYRIRYDGTQRLELADKVRGWSISEGVSWSPDGKRIAFMSNGIEIINVDGTDRRHLVKGTNPRWRPGDW